MYIFDGVVGPPEPKSLQQQNISSFDVISVAKPSTRYSHLQDNNSQ